MFSTLLWFAQPLPGGATMLDELLDDELKRALLQAIQEVFETRRSPPPGISASTSPPPAVPFSNQALQLATAVLFLQVLRADHEMKHDEHLALLGAVARVLGLQGEAAAMLVRVAEEKVSQIPLIDLLNALEVNADQAQRKQVVENLWRLAYADAELQGHEEYFVRKVCLGIGLSMADLVETKVTAREAFLRDDL